MILFTIDSKIIRAVEIIPVQKLIPNIVLLNKYLLNHIFKLYAVFNKHEMIKIVNETKGKSQVLSQMLEYFCC